MNETTCRRIVRGRSDGDCEVRVAGWCQGRATNFQHRKARGQGGLWLPSNGLDVCGSGNASGCHGYIHQHPEAAVAKGWTVPSWADPATTPVEVWMRGGMQAFALLDDVGDFHIHHAESEPTPCAKCGEVCDLIEMWSTQDDQVECTDCHVNARLNRGVS